MWMKIENKWRKARTSLARNLCVGVPEKMDNPSPSLDQRDQLCDSDLVASSSITLTNQDSTSTATSSSSAWQLSSGGIQSSKRTCAICLTNLKPGKGQAIFTAECGHDFHFHCIASNVKHGNLICPICRAKWKEVPCRFHCNSSFYAPPEPTVFDDDEVLQDQREVSSAGRVEVNVYPEVSAVPKSTSVGEFAILLHLKAPPLSIGCSPRAAVDLVTVLDISGSMAGTKLALLKRAMSFVIQNLCSYDRLSIVAFSSAARRLIPLRRMTDYGRQRALQAVGSLVSNGGTNIAEGLRKGVKVMEDRRVRNPVSSIILLSDGHDTYTYTSSTYRLSPGIPVYAFGFGSDHDADSMHSISESSGGTFSFIESESAIQDAFAQCIGGLLSVVVQNVRIRIHVSQPGLKLVSLKAGSYKTRLSGQAGSGSGSGSGSIHLGDLYAGEERDFLVTVGVPENETSLLKVGCSYRNPFDESTVENEVEVRIRRPDFVRDVLPSPEVDRHRNRLRAAEAMLAARSAAENGDFGGAVAILRSCRFALSETKPARAGDRLWVTLDAEMKEMEGRMVNRHVYESSGRAYVLSGFSSHSFQRATARADSTDNRSLVRAYQTEAMLDMINRSHTFFPAVQSGLPGSS